MKRYLLYLAYLGQHYSGFQIQNLKGVKTVAKAILHAGRSLEADGLRLQGSSRTDRGVHALCSAAVLDVEQHPEKPITANHITSRLNEQFFNDKEEIRILYTRRVPLDFYVRRPLYRSYLYRFCFVKNPQVDWALPFPPQEYQKTWLIRDTLDMQSVFKAADIMSGTHNFSYFTPPTKFHKIKHWKNPVKTMVVKIEKGDNHLENYMPYFPDYFSSWNAVITGDSFLYRQVRLMMGVLAEVGRGETSLDELHHMLQDPKDYKCRYSEKLMRRLTAPSWALYLANVQFDENDMKLRDDEETEEVTQPPPWLQYYTIKHNIHPNMFTSQHHKNYPSLSQL